MRISVRSSILSVQPLPGLSLFKGFAAVPKQASAFSLLSPGGNPIAGRAG